VVYLCLGQPGPARRDLDRALAAAPSATAYFHRARACLADQDRRAAAEALAAAKRLDLQPAGLHPLEHGAYREMLALIDRR
jgi:hypothetical protein